MFSNLVLAMVLQAWTLFEKGHLFDTRNPDTEMDQAICYAEMVALFGSPPRQFSEPSKDRLKFWDEDCNRSGLPKTISQKIEARELRLESENKTPLLDFLRNTLQWRPGDRPTAEELLADKLIQKHAY
ncbi:hypothetical protein BJX64DRAFT_286194 [Aspergillus heterothallicus]